MIDVKKTRNNFQKFPSLKQICDPVIVVKPQTTVKTSTTITTPRNSKSQATTEPLSTEVLRNSINNTKSKNIIGIPSKNNKSNPVREANQHFFLISEFQDQNFLKAECELAHAQVYKPPTAIEKNSNKSLLPAINNKRLSKANLLKPIPSSNNNSLQSSAAKAATINGMRRTGNGTHLGTTTAVATSINKVDISYSQFKGLSSVSVTQSSSASVPGSSSSTSGVNKKSTSVYTTNNSSSSYTATKLSRNAVKPLVHRTAGTGTAATVVNSTKGSISSSSPNQQNNTNNNNGSNSSINSLTNSGNNNMQTSLDQDDIKFIDSDDQPTTGPMLAERKCEQPRCYLNHSHSSAITKARVRPKSTIICSTSSSSAASSSSSNSSVFEKVNNYKYGNCSLPMPATERRTETAIDSNSIRASIEKFNSFSEQKRLPLSSVTLRSHSGSGSTSNLQHHRHSSDLDNSNLRLQSGGGGSLTRTSYRSSGGSTAGKVITSIYPNASAAVSSVTSRHHHHHHHALSSSPGGTGSLPLKSSKHYVQAEDSSLSTLSSSVDGDVSKKKLTAISGGLCGDNTDDNSVSSPSAKKKKKTPTTTTTPILLKTQ